MMGEGDDEVDVYVHVLTGEYSEIAGDGTVCRWEDGAQVRSDEPHREMLRRVLPTREQWLVLGGYGPGGPLANEELAS